MVDMLTAVRSLGRKGISLRRCWNRKIWLEPLSGYFPNFKGERCRSPIDTLAPSLPAAELQHPPG